MIDISKYSARISVGNDCSSGDYSFTGSGTLVKLPEGVYLVTNQHVINKALPNKPLLIEFPSVASSVSQSRRVADFICGKQDGGSSIRGEDDYAFCEIQMQPWMFALQATEFDKPCITNALTAYGYSEKYHKQAASSGELLNKDATIISATVANVLTTGNAFTCQFENDVLCNTMDDQLSGLSGSGLYSSDQKLIGIVKGRDQSKFVTDKQFDAVSISWIIEAIYQFLEGNSGPSSHSGAEWPDMRAWWLLRNNRRGLTDDSRSLMLLPFLLARSDPFLLFIASSRRDGLEKTLNRLTQHYETQAALRFPRVRWESWNDRIPSGTLAQADASRGTILNLCVDKRTAEQLVLETLRDWEGCANRGCLIFNLWSERPAKACAFARRLQQNGDIPASAEFLSVISDRELLAADEPAPESQTLFSDVNFLKRANAPEQKLLLLLEKRIATVKGWAKLISMLGEWAGSEPSVRLETERLCLLSVLPSGPVLRQWLQGIPPMELETLLGLYAVQLQPVDLIALYDEILHLPADVLGKDLPGWERVRKQLVALIGAENAAFLAGDAPGDGSVNPYAAARRARRATKDEIERLLATQRSSRRLPYWALLLNSPYATDYLPELLAEPGGRALSFAVLNREEPSGSDPALTERIASIRSFIHEEKENDT